MKIAPAVFLAWLVTTAACSSRSPEKRDASIVAPGSDRTRSLLEAEVLRDPLRVTAEDLSSYDPRIRRAAVRALARTGDEGSRSQLLRATSDEDIETLAWAAFGLGRLCTAANADATIRKITTRAATLLLTHAPGSEALAGSRLDPWLALAQALGRCGNDRAERILRSWMTANVGLTKTAILGLDLLAQTTHQLQAETIVALLDAAESDRSAVVALLVLSRLNSIDPLVARRLLNLTPRLLETAGDERRYLMRVLPLVGEASVPILERVVIDDGQYHPLERVEALRALGKFGSIGQDSLAKVLPRIVGFDASPSEATLLSAKWSVIVELFEQLKEAPRRARAQLAKLAALSVDADQKPPVLRRLGYLRCHAAALLAEDRFSPAIEHCDPSPAQREHKLALIQVLERMQLGGRDADAFASLAADPDPVVAMAALMVLPAHDELEKGQAIVIAALGSESQGVVATAARGLASGSRGGKRLGQPSAELSTAIERAWSKTWPEDAIELRLSLIDAVGTLGLLSAKAKILDACGSPIKMVREHAAEALHRLGEPRQQCAIAPPRVLPKEFDRLALEPVSLRFDTELGPLEITLDPAMAPLSVSRLTELARSGFFDGITVHRVVTGFVVQFGDRSPDGFGGAGLAPLPDELSPQIFGPLDVGMALSGPESGSSQIFIALGPYPQLGGQYTKVGRASVGWDQLAVGDRISKVSVSAKSEVVRPL